MDVYLALPSLRSFLSTHSSHLLVTGIPILFWLRENAVCSLWNVSCTINVVAPTSPYGRSLEYEKKLYVWNKFQRTKVTSKTIQDGVPFIHHVHLLCSVNHTSITIVQFPTGSHPQHISVFTVNHHCFLLCTSVSRSHVHSIIYWS